MVKVVYIPLPFFPRMWVCYCVITVIITMIVVVMVMVKLMYTPLKLLCSTECTNHPKLQVYSGYIVRGPILSIMWKIWILTFLLYYDPCILYEDQYNLNATQATAVYMPAPDKRQSLKLIIYIVSSHTIELKQFHLNLLKLKSVSMQRKPH